jgi:FkbM family methyltransferase
MSIKNKLKSIIRQSGYKIVNLNPRNDMWKLLSDLLTLKQVSVVCDIGANKGQFLTKFKNHIDSKIDGYVCFEPIEQSYKELKSLIRSQKKYFKIEAHNIALGHYSGTAEINITPNLVSSSLMKPSDEFYEYMTTENTELDIVNIPIYRMDDYIEKDKSDILKNKSANCFLKLDVQGFELNVLDGFGDFIESAKVILLECSMVESYKDRPLIGDIVLYMQKRGFYVSGVFPGFFDEKKIQLFEVDVVFSKEL